MGVTGFTNAFFHGTQCYFHTQLFFVMNKNFFLGLRFVSSSKFLYASYSASFLTLRFLRKFFRRWFFYTKGYERYNFRYPGPNCDFRFNLTSFLGKFKMIGLTKISLKSWHIYCLHLQKLCKLKQLRNFWK